MADNNNKSKIKIWMHNIREKQKATALSCSLFLTGLDRFSAFWVIFAAKIHDSNEVLLNNWDAIR